MRVLVVLAASFALGGASLATAAEHTPSDRSAATAPGALAPAATAPAVTEAPAPPAPTLALPAAPAPAADTEETRLPVRPGPRPLDPAPTVTTPIGYMNLSHEDQVGLAILPGSGYRMLVPYKEQVYCGQLDRRVCSGRIPWFLDIEPSFGLSQGWDVLATFRLGIERDFHTHRQFAAMPGFRYWFDRDTALRLYATLQFVYDQTNQNNPDVSNLDLGFRNANGFMYDIIRNFSLYFQFAETIGLKRWFRFEMDGGFGLQARLP